LTAAHLGGHCYKTWTDAGALAFLHREFGVASMLDIGCGPGWMREIADELGITWQGVDGDAEVAGDRTMLHDFTTGEANLSDSYDLAWSVEFLEHVKAEHQQNYLAAFSRCNLIACTAAPPGWKGHHHVNCRPREYWIDVFSGIGFDYDADATSAMVEASTMKRRKGRSFMMITGMLFCRR